MFAAVLSFGVVLVGLVREARARKEDIARVTAERRDDELTAQARRVGGYITFPPEPPPMNDGSLARLLLHVVNASDLPIRDVRGWANEVGGERRVWRFSPIPVLPHTPPDQPFTTDVLIPSECRRLALILDFDDDTGARWRKYGTKAPLEQLEPGHASPMPGPDPLVGDDAEPPPAP